MTSGVEKPILDHVEPCRDICETLEALTGADVCSPAQAMLDAGSMHSDPQAEGLGALLTFARLLAGKGVLEQLVKRELVIAAEAAGKRFVDVEAY